MIETFDVNSRIIRVKLFNSSVTTGAGLTGLTHSSAGLIISTIADNEAVATAYTQAAGNIETIATLGSYAAPTSGKCRFRELDATNHPGLYEIQLADARLGVSGAKELIVTISGAANLAQCDLRIELKRFDMQQATPAVNVAAISGDSAAADNLEAACDGAGYNIGGGSVVAASVTSGVTLAADSITSAQFDEITAFPLKLADAGATAVARTGADSDTLETLSDQIDGLSADAGSGARTVVVTVTDGTDPLEHAHIRLSKGITVLVQPASASGAATFYCDDGTWTLAVSLAGYAYTATTHVVDGTEAITAAMTPVAIAGAPDPAQSAAYIYTYDAHGDLEAGVSLTFQLITPAPSSENAAHTAETFTATSDANGLLTVALMRGARYRARRGLGQWTLFDVADASTYALPELLGR